MKRDIFRFHKAEITLGDKWPNESRSSTLIHEFLHAVGFDHEQKLKGSAKYLQKNDEKIPNDWKFQYQTKEQKGPFQILNSSRFDPQSIMIYSEDECMQGKRKYNNRLFAYLNGHMGEDPIWTLVERNGFMQNKTMSPLDKLKLNIIYPPFFSQVYQPKLNKITELYYCSRKVMEDHNYPDKNYTDGFCGPNNGPNCFACRCIKNPGLPKINEKGNKVWQGFSGMFYCGKYFRKMAFDHDGFCGPDNGFSCAACSKLLE